MTELDNQFVKRQRNTQGTQYSNYYYSKGGTLFTAKLNPTLLDFNRTL